MKIHLDRSGTHYDVGMTGPSLLQSSERRAGGEQGHHPNIIRLQTHRSQLWKHGEGVLDIPGAHGIEGYEISLAHLVKDGAN